MSETSISVLITNVHSTQNAGDLALLEMAIHLIKAGFGNPRVTILTNWPDKPYGAYLENLNVIASPWAIVGAGNGNPIWRQVVSAMRGYGLTRLAAQGVRVSLPSRWRKVAEAYKAADLIVGVSGNQFYSTGRYGWPFPLTLLQVDLAHRFHKPFYVLPQSIGPLRRGWERRMLGSAYGHARSIFLRDAVSLQLAHEIGLPESRVHYAPDPAFAYAPADHEAAVQVLTQHGYDQALPSIGVTLIASQGGSLDHSVIMNYYAAMARLLERIHSEMQVQVVLFSQVRGPTRYEDDRLAVEEVRRLVGPAATDFCVVDEPIPPALLKACYGCMSLFIGSRLHSGIFAMGMRVPVLLIGYLSKTRGLMDSLNLADWVINLDDVNEITLWNALQQAWSERERRAAQLERLLPQLEQSINEIADQIKADYARLAV